MGLVAGRRVELRRRKALVRCAAEVGPIDLGAREVGAGESGAREAEVGEILACEVRTRKVGGVEVHVGEDRFAKVSARQRGAREGRIAEVLSPEVAAGKVVANEVNTGQIVGPVAGRRVELRERESPNVHTSVVVVAAIEIRSAYFGIGEVGVCKRGSKEVCATKVLA